MRIVVTGGAGFVGSQVAEYFVRKNNEIIICDNLSRVQLLGKSVADPLYNWNYLRKNHDNVNLLKVDITDFQALEEASKGADIIIHAAAQVAVTTSLADPRTDFTINALGTFNVLEVARMNDSILVFCSTNKVHGENVNAIPVEEKPTRYSFSDPKYAQGIAEDFDLDMFALLPVSDASFAADQERCRHGLGH